MIDNYWDKEGVKMSQKKEAVIKCITPESIAEEIGLEEGDIIKKINSRELRDIIDYQYLTSDEALQIEVEKKSGEAWILDIEKDPYESLGILFGEETFDGMKKCNNNCVFCFVDNLPSNLRKSLYIKDDDYRHSFLYGNFITLTNLKQSELERIVEFKLSPLYVSVHSTDENLRREMLNNKNADKILKQLNFLVSGGIEIHTQVVLCPGLNDGKYLDKTISDLSSMLPDIKSLALVPVGLTKFKKNINLKNFTKKESQELIKKIEKIQHEFLKNKGTRFVYLADEFYLKAGFRIPNDEYYEDYSQLENGIGLARIFLEEINEYLPDKIITRDKVLEVIIVTGESSYNILNEVVQEILNKIKNINITVKKIKNDFFGNSVTVTGLITGSDIIKNLQEYKGKNKVVLIPDVMLKDNSDLFLDDLTVEDISKELNLNVKVIHASGKNLIEQLLER